MKHILGILFLFSSSLIAQDAKLEGLHGLYLNTNTSQIGENNQNSATQIYEWRGYTIRLENRNIQLNTKGIEQIKKKYKLKKIQQEYYYKSVEHNIYVIESVEGGTDAYPMFTNQLCYIVPINDKEVTIILYQTMNIRNRDAEQAFLNGFLDGTIEKYITPTSDASVIDFAGRTIELGTACKWVSPHNVFCRGKGEISWSEFQTIAEAQADMEQSIRKNEESKYLVLKDDVIDVSFEGVPSTARRLVYKHNYLSPYSLIVYYVAEEVRGRYVSCIMSHYAESKDDYYLAPLLLRIMSLDSVPSYAYYELDEPIEELIEEAKIAEMKETAKKRRDYQRYGVMVDLAAMQPLGSLKKVLDLSPNIGVKLGGELKNNFRLDVRLNFTIPIHPAPFTYFDKELSYQVKSQVVMVFGVSGSHITCLKKNLYWEKYIGAGVAAIVTDKRKNEDDDTQGNYEATAFNLTLGQAIRYKRIGCFIEYNRAQFRSNNAVLGLGESSLRMGLNYTFCLPPFF